MAPLSRHGRERAGRPRTARWRREAPARRPSPDGTRPPLRGARTREEPAAPAVTTRPELGVRSVVAAMHPDARSAVTQLHEGRGPGPSSRSRSTTVTSGAAAEGRDAGGEPGRAPDAGAMSPTPAGGLRRAGCAVAHHRDAEVDRPSPMTIGRCRPGSEADVERTAVQTGGLSEPQRTARGSDQPVPPPARAQPGRLVSRGARRRSRRRGARTSPSSCPSATRRVTGAT